MSRLENLHLADEILHLMDTKYKDYTPCPSIKFNKKLFKISHQDQDQDQDQDHIYDETDIEIENIDTVSAAIIEVNAGNKVLVLNMANAYKPGGGFLSGATAQEEDLFRCTNLSKALTTDLYPMRCTDVIYSPKIHILRDSLYKDLDQDQVKEIGVFSIAATQDPYINTYGMLSNYVYNTTKCKIHLMFQLALMQKYDCLVLSALGCGAFNNPPYEIAKIFCKVCSMYAQKFKRIVFAIKSGPDNDNCDIFQHVFLETFNTDEPLELEPMLYLESDDDELPTYSDIGWGGPMGCSERRGSMSNYLGSDFDSDLDMDLDLDLDLDESDIWL